MKIDATYEETVSFHGHSCPGLAIGYKAVQVAIKALRLDRAKDEELVAIVENDACGVDAFQYVLGVTFGKGNLIHNDYGKHVYTIIKRDNGRGIRISIDFPKLFGQDRKRFSQLLEKSKNGTAGVTEQRELREFKEKRVNVILSGSAYDFIKKEMVDIKIPPKARIADSVTCDNCGEKVMSTKIKIMENRNLCVPCLKKLT